MPTTSSESDSNDKKKSKTRKTKPKVYKRFVEGLKKYNLTYAEVRNWTYCGGNMNEGIKYFKQCFENSQLLPYINKCICGHDIIENCYITNENKSIVLIVGNCCIKQFIETRKNKTCEICGDCHKNKIVNRCSSCRVGICDECNRRCNPSYKTCFRCFIKKNNIIIHTRYN